MCYAGVLQGYTPLQDTGPPLCVVAQARGSPAPPQPPTTTEPRTTTPARRRRRCSPLCTARIVRLHPARPPARAHRVPPTRRWTHLHILLRARTSLAPFGRAQCCPSFCARALESPRSKKAPAAKREGSKKRGICSIVDSRVVPYRSTDTTATRLNFADRTGCGVFVYLWPQMIAIAACHYTLTPLLAADDRFRSVRVCPGPPAGRR